LIPYPNAKKDEVSAALEKAFLPREHVHDLLRDW